MEVHMDENHNMDVRAMIMAAKQVYEKTGFENYGVPFCMTIEAEPLGVKLDMGTKMVEPRVTGYNTLSIEEIIKKFTGSFASLIWVLQWLIS
jgi:[methyl-Co(III) methanol-specific corrinoid protein]:coenzyme M methyltransferase